MSHEAFPLEWPVGRPRTPSASRTKSSYSVTRENALQDLLHELKLMGARHVVVSSNIPVRRDGLMRGTGVRIPDDPGVAVYWHQNDGDHVIACDCWVDVRSNIRSIGLAVAALRALDRSGASGVLDNALVGMKALPASTQRPWRTVLEFPEGEALSPATLRVAYRKAALKHHPDHGGAPGAMAEVNAAHEDGMNEWRRA